MTKQTEGATVRETRAEYRGRPIVAEIHSGYLMVRLKGTSTTYSADWESVADWLEMRAAKAVNGDIPKRRIGR